MLPAALKLGVPIAAAGLLALHGLTSVFAAPALGLTDVTGAGGDCTTPTSSAVCAPLFPADGEVMWPGKAPRQAQAQLTWHGPSATRTFGVYFSRYDPKLATAGGGYCQAPDPAAKLNLVIRDGAATVYQGTVSDFAQNHRDPQSLLELGNLAPGAAHTFTFSVGLDRSAGNEYMGCTTTADIAWYAQ